MCWGHCSQGNGRVQAAGAEVRCVRDRVPNDLGSPSREEKLIALTGSNARWAPHK